MAAAAIAMVLLSSVSPAHAAGPPAKQVSVLSVRLQSLERPALPARSLATRARELGVGIGGPGGLEIAHNGDLLVMARVVRIDASLLAALRDAGARITFLDRSQRAVTFWVPLRALWRVARVPSLQYVGEVLAPLTNGVCRSGTHVSEGDSQLRAAAARSTFHVDGSGVTVGVLSSSFNYLGGAAADVAGAELPGAGNPCGDTTPVNVLQDAGTTNEGRAMAQIVHDLAPGAAIDFAAGNGGQSQFAANIRALAARGAKVIVDDVTYVDEPLYQLGVAGAAINAVAGRGVAYFASAGNFNVISSGRNVSSYEASAFRPMPCPSAVVTADRGASSIRCHTFSGSGPPRATDRLTFKAPGQFQVTLGWDQPEFAVTTDFDLALIDDTTGGVVAIANSDNRKSQVPVEVLSTNVAAHSYSLVVVHYAGASLPRFKLVMYSAKTLQSAQYVASTPGVTIGPTLEGHVAAPGAITVGAVPFSNANLAEAYSSRGPATFCWAPVHGTKPSPPITPCLSKPIDVAATTGVQNSFFGSGPLHRFYGTSAAAPHAAAIAALQLEHRACATPATIRAAQIASGRAVGPYGSDVVGAGLVDAVVALADTRCPQAITFRVLPARVLGAGSFRLSAFASSSSRLPVSFVALTPSVCTVGARTALTLRAAGTCRVLALQAGNATFARATPVSRAFAVRSRS